VLRPRAVAQTHKGVDDLRTELSRVRDDLRAISGAINELRSSDAALGRQQEEGFASVRQQLAALDEIKSSVAKLEIRESQLRAVARRDIALEGREAALSSILCEHDIRAHVDRQFAAAELQDHPFPHLVVDRVLPDAFYQALITGLPPIELFYDRRPNKRQLTVPFKLAPSYSRRVWDYMANTVVPEVLMPRIVNAFRRPLAEWLRYSFPALGDNPLERLRMNPSDGRILLRTRGYVIPPHRDPKWGFVTGLLYLARPGDSETWGTQLYTVNDDQEARGVAPYWIDKQKCRPVADVPFVPNRILIFLNSAGAHGASIPEDAQPEALERYAYQFRVGPGEEATSWMLESLPAERRPFWAGKMTDY
jgi:hypothetical protein